MAGLTQPASRSRPVRIIFDLSGTIFGAFDLSLRPGIRDTIEALRSAGYRVEFWTSGSKEQYECLLKAAGIDGTVYPKRTALPFMPDVCVDDEPEEWMPGNRYKVDIHLAQDMPGAPILVAELLGSAGRNFYWD